MDGSPHDWFEGRGPRCTLIVFIDDATSRLLALRFVAAETTEAYMETLRGHLAEHGRPVALYSDRYSVFRVNRKDGEDAPTQFTRALLTLDIEPIHASTPQAKGRVERANLTLQDRLVKELRLRGIDGMEAANAYLPEFAADHNRRFAVAPREAEDRHRPVLHDADELALILSEHHVRKLKNLTFRFERREHQLTGEGKGHPASRRGGDGVQGLRRLGGGAAQGPAAGAPRAGGRRGGGSGRGREGCPRAGGRGQGGAGGAAGLEAGAGPPVAAAVQAVRAGSGMTAPRVFHRLPTAAFWVRGDRARGKTVENASRPVRTASRGPRLAVPSLGEGDISTLHRRGHFYFALTPLGMHMQEWRRLN